MGGDPRNHWPIRIGERRYVLEPAAAGFGPISIIRQHQLDNEEANERSFHNPGIWRRYRDTWVQGSGQEWLDDGRNPNPERFRTSRHIDVGEDRSMRLTQDFDGGTILTSTERQFLVVGGNPPMLYWLFDNEAYVKTGADVDGWVNIGPVGGAGPVSSVTFVNDQLVTTHGEGSRMRNYTPMGTGGTWADWGDVALGPEWTAYCGGRLVAGQGPLLFELDVNGSKQNNADIMTHLNTSFDWMGAASAPIGIYAWGDNESQGEIWYSTVNDADGTLNHPVPVAELPVGEWITALRFYGSIVVIGSNNGIRIGVASTDGTLRYGKIILETDYPIWDFDLQGQYIYAPIVALGAEFSDPEGGITEVNEYGLMKIDLGQFVDNEELVPAYWSDLTEASTNTALTTHAVETYGDRRWFAGTDGSDVTVFRENPVDYERNTGFLLTGRITFGTPEHKRFIRLRMAWDPLPLGARVRAFIRKDFGDDWQAVVEDQAEGSRGVIASIDPDIIGPHCELVFAIDRASSRTETPVIRSWFLEAIPLPYKTREFMLPLQISEGVQETYGGSKGYLDPVDELSYLLTLEDTREIVDFEFGALSYKAVVDEVRIDQTREITRTHRWSEDYGVLTGSILVRMTTINEREAADVGLE